MCIRDRIDKIQKNKYFRYPVAAIMYILAIGNFAYANNYFCLLYTSDAADERSSVDLGGRRIIKKKNISEKSEGLDNM